MKIHEIAKVTGIESSQVAAELNVEGGQGVAFREVDSAVADAYIASKRGPDSPVVTSEEKMARFVSAKGKNHIIPAPAGSKRGDIRFKDWVLLVPDDSPEAEDCRTAYYRDALRLWEVKDGPYEDDEVRMGFRDYLNALVHTGGPGHSEHEGTSTAGIRRVQAYLTLPERAKIGFKTAKAVVNAVVKSKHVDKVVSFRGIEA